MPIGHRRQFSVYSKLFQRHLIEITWKQRWFNQSEPSGCFLFLVQMLITLIEWLNVNFTVKFCFVLFITTEKKINFLACFGAILFGGIVGLECNCQIAFWPYFHYQVSRKHSLKCSTALTHPRTQSDCVCDYLSTIRLEIYLLQNLKFY